MVFSNLKVSKEQRISKALIVGVDKCGAKVFTKILFQHPNIVITEGGGTLNYLKQMSETRDGVVTIGNLPDYFTRKRQPAKIKQEIGPIKIIIAVCNPLKQIVSLFQTLKSKQKIGDNSSLLNLTMFKNSKGNYKGNWSSPLLYPFLYRHHMKPWLHAFTRHKVHVMNDQDLHTELQSLESFLQLPHYYRKEMFYYNEEKQQYCYKHGPNKTKPNDCFPKKEKITSQEGLSNLGPLKNYLRQINRQFFKLMGEKYHFESSWKAQ